MERCPQCGHASKVPRLSWIDRLWGLKPQCPEPSPVTWSSMKFCQCTDPWHVAGT
ncbi:hypothetical protein [Nocardioides sp.]|uniref:hypothetical protein n=1 Tax=Nocardioides sp. TaxID=35761 RepID=UPI003D0F5DD7